MNHDHPFVQRLIAAGLIPAPPARPVTPIDAPPAVAGTPEAERYANAALDSECGAVATAAEGTRNDTLNRAAFNVGTLVAGGFLDEQWAFDRLAEAATHAGLSTYEIDNTVPRAMRDASRSPRQVKLNPPVQPAFTLDPTAFTPGESDAESDGEPQSWTAKIQALGRWVFATPATPPLIWGTGQQALWVEGESLIVTGPPGVGKSTIVQQLIFARAGLAESFLGLAVAPTTSRVLYLAMDRPRQIARSMRRMVEPQDQALMDDKMRVWQGPLPFDIVTAPATFAALAHAAGADTLVVDSVKDTSVGLVESRGAGIYNRARQIALDAGVQMVEIAHQRKSGSGDKAPKTLADVHGGMELTAGAGSVMLVWGDAGDPVVEMRHLKQPQEQVGPWTLVHDGLNGRTTIEEKIDAFRLLQDNPAQAFTVAQVAERLIDGPKVSRADIERARRQLDRLAADGVAVSSEMVTGPGKPEKRYQWSDNGARSTTWNGD